MKNRLPNVYCILFCTWYFVHCVVPMGFSPMGNYGRFPQGKPGATESRYPTLIYNKAHAGSFRVCIVHRTLTWTTGSLTCLRDHSYARIYTRRWSHRLRVSITFLTRKNSHNFFLCSWRGSNLWSLDLESDILPTEPSRHSALFAYRDNSTLVFLADPLWPCIKVRSRSSTRAWA